MLKTSRLSACLMGFVRSQGILFKSTATISTEDSDIIMFSLCGVLARVSHVPGTLHPVKS